MALKFIKHTWQKVVLATILILTVLLLLLAFLVNIYWSPILADKVKTAVIKSSDSLYTADFADAKLHILQGKIVLYDINFTPDTAVYNRHKKELRAPDNLVKLHVKRLVLSHIHPFTLYFKQKLNIDQVILSAPQVSIIHRPNRDTIHHDNRTVWQKIKKDLHSIHIGQILLNDVQFRYDDRSGSKPVVSELKEMNVKGNDLLIDSATQLDTSRLLYCKDIVTKLLNYNGKTSDGLYTYKVNSLTLSTYNSRLTMEGLTLDPAKDYFNKSRKDRFTARVDSLQLNNFDFLAYHKYNRLTASSFVINGGSLDIFKNPNKKKEYKNKVSSFPNLAIYKIPVDIKIDTLLLDRVDVTYGEFNTKSHKTGALTFNNTHGKFLNVTTNKAALQKNNIGTAQLNTSFMNRGKLNVFFTFNLTDKVASYSYKGKLGSMDLQDINPAIVPFAMVKVTSGTLKEFTFDIKGNAKSAHGRVALLYNDLKVKLLKADTANDVLQRKTIESLFANIFIIKHNNPDNPGGVPRSVNVNYIRPIEFPFFKTIWKTLLAGIKPCVGLSVKIEQATTTLMDKNIAEKQDRQIKQDQRKARRADRKLKRQQKQAEKEALKNNGDN